jgi:hypothetical protein
MIKKNIMLYVDMHYYNQKHKELTNSYIIHLSHMIQK